MGPGGTHDVVAWLIRVQVVPTLEVRVRELLELVLAAHEVNETRDVVLSVSYGNRLMSSNTP